MSNVQITDLIKFFMVIAGFVAVAYKAFDYLKEKAKETSVGAAKVQELVKEDAAIRQEFQELKKREDLQDDKIEDLEKHYDNLINRVWDFFKK